MVSTLVGYPSKPDASGAVEPLELGEVVIAAEPLELRCLANHLLAAARELEQGVSEVRAFSFRDAGPPRNTRSQVIVVRRQP